MILLVPLIATALTVRVGAGWLAGRGIRTANQWASWRAAAASGMAAVYVCTGVTHFVEPQRSGLEATIPPVIPEPGVVVAISGVAEFALAAGLIIPRTRRWAALASAIFLILVFPANVIAAGGVDHPAAPTTPLLPRALLQLVFLGFSLTPLLGRASTAEEDTPPSSSTPDSNNRD